MKKKDLVLGICLMILGEFGNMNMVRAGESLVDAWERQNQEGFSQGNTGDGRDRKPVETMILSTTESEVD